MSFPFVSLQYHAGRVLARLEGLDKRAEADAKANLESEACDLFHRLVFDSMRDSVLRSSFVRE